MTNALLVQNNQKPEKNYWETRAGSDAGQGYFWSNIAWMAIGLATDPTYQVAIAGAINFVGSRARIKFSETEIAGVKNFGNKVGASAGVIANFVLTASAVVAGDPMAIASNLIIGTAAFFDIKSGRYRAKYENHASPLLRETLGQSRRLVGLIRGASRIPLIAFCVATGNIPMAVVTAGLLAADTLYAFSQPQKEFGKNVKQEIGVAAAAVKAPVEVAGETAVYPLMPTRVFVRARRVSMKGVRRVLKHSRAHARILPPAVFRRAERAMRPMTTRIANIKGKLIPRRDYA